MDNLNSKSWYQSRGVWGNIISLICLFLKGFGVDLPEGVGTEATDILYNLGILFGQGLSIYGRVKASKPIKG